MEACPWAEESLQGEEERKDGGGRDRQRTDKGEKRESEEDVRVNRFCHRAENYGMSPRLFPWKRRGSSFMFHALLPTVTVLRLKDG